MKPTLLAGAIWALIAVALLVLVAKTKDWWDGEL